MKIDVLLHHLCTACRPVGVEESLEAAVDLKRAPHTSGDDGEIVCRVAALGVLPVDDRGRSLPIEKDVLAEKISNLASACV